MNDLVLNVTLKLLAVRRGLINNLTLNKNIFINIITITCYDCKQSLAKRVQRHIENPIKYLIQAF